MSHLQSIIEKCTEIWKTIKEYPEYQVSNLGRIKSFKNGAERILKPFPNRHGYVMVYLSVRGKAKSFMVHRIVGLHFMPNNNPEKKEINHKNGIKEDNRVENLEWMTRGENVKHAYDNGFNKITEKHYSKWRQSKKVYQYTLDRKLVRVWDSSTQIKRELGIKSFRHCCQGKNKTSAGFMWSYTPYDQEESVLEFISKNI